MCLSVLFFFFKQKTAYEMRISDWSSDVCSSDLANGRSVTPAGSFPRIPYRESMLKYGSDKPDPRNPLVIRDLSSHFAGSGFGRFADIVPAGDDVRAIPVAGTAEEWPHFFHDRKGVGRGGGGRTEGGAKEMEN